MRKGMFINSTKNYEEVPDLRQLETKQLDLWQRVLGTSIIQGDRFCNPWREDKHPDCYLEEVQGRYRLRDWADCYAFGCRWHGKDIFAILMQLNNCNFNRALQIAYYEILMEKNPTILKHVNKVKPKFEIGTPIIDIKIENRKFNVVDRTYWYHNTGITRLNLSRLNVVPVKTFWVSRNMGIYKKHVCKTLTYAIYINRKIKLYQPETRLFLSEHTQDDIGHYRGTYHFFKDKLILTKNFKSVAAIVSNIGSLSLNLKNSTSYSWTHNEGGIPNDDLLIALTKLYDQIYILYDNDETGLRAGKKLEERFIHLREKMKHLNEKIDNTKIKHIHFDTAYNDVTYLDYFGNKKYVQDAFDVAKHFGPERMIKELKQLMDGQ